MQSKLFLITVRGCHTSRLSMEREHNAQSVNCQALDFKKEPEKEQRRNLYPQRKETVGHRCFVIRRNSKVCTFVRPYFLFPWFLPQRVSC